MKTICLDIGNVLCRVDFIPFLEHLSKSLNITLEESQYFLNRTQKLHDLGCTSIADELRDHFKIKSPVIMRELLDLWDDKVIQRDRTYQLENVVLKHNLQVALLSNIGFEHAKVVGYWASGNGPFSLKSVRHFSCFVGARKPSALFYQSFLWEYPEFKGSLYVDDLQENLDASHRFGFQPFHMALDSANYGERIKELDELIANFKSA
jgi:hypothetical protein